MSVPTAYDSQLTLPVFENIKGTISAAVMVGEISAMFCASSSTKFRQFGLSLDSILSVVMARAPFIESVDGLEACPPSGASGRGASTCMTQ